MKSHSSSQVILKQLPDRHQSITVLVPAVTIDEKKKQARDEFIHHVSHAAASMNAKNQGPVIGFAPLGGTRVTAFKELNLDGLVIVDWDRTGTPAAINAAFEKPELARSLAETLKESLNQGGMSTNTVMHANISAQILARLRYELGVSDVCIQYYKNDLSVDLSSWDVNDVVRADHPALITRYLFTCEGKPRELVYVSSSITSDNVTSRDALPLAILQNLAPDKFNWSSLCADGLIFFSENEKNGLRKGNQELLQMLCKNSGIMLDYPYGEAYHTPYAFDGITGMDGRAELERWGLRERDRFLAKGMHLFGYAGFDGRDNVRLYEKTDGSEKHAQTAIFKVDDFEKVDQDYVYHLDVTRITALRA